VIVIEMILLLVVIFYFDDCLMIDFLKFDD